VTIFDYSFDIEFNFASPVYLNAFTLAIEFIGLSKEYVCVNLELSPDGRKGLVYDQKKDSKNGFNDYIFSFFCIAVTAYSPPPSTRYQKTRGIMLEKP